MRNEKWAKTATNELRESSSRRWPAEEKPWHGGPPTMTSADGNSASQCRDSSLAGVAKFMS